MLARRFAIAIVAMLSISSTLLAGQLAVSSELGSEIRHRPEIELEAEKLGGEQRANLPWNPELFPEQSKLNRDTADKYGEYFEVDVSDSAICSQFGFLSNRITGIVYPRIYRANSVEAALSFAATRALNNQYQRGGTNVATIAEKVTREAARISYLSMQAEARLIPVDLGQNDDTKIFFYANLQEGTATVRCHTDEFYKRCDIDANLDILGFNTTVHKSSFRKPHVMSCYFLAFEKIRRAVLNGAP